MKNAIAGHLEAPHLRELQKLLAKEVNRNGTWTEEYEKAVDGITDTIRTVHIRKLRAIDEQDFSFSI